MSWDIGIDIGTRNVRASVSEATRSYSSALAYRNDEELPFMAGDGALELYGRENESIKVVFPLVDGLVFNSFHLLGQLKWLFGEYGIGRRSSVLMTCSPHARPAHMEAMMEAAMEAGAGSCTLLRSDAACALGAGLEVSGPEAKLCIDVGAGKITATLFTFGRVAAFGFLPYGMNRIDERIQRIIRTERGYLIGPRMSEEIKLSLGTALTSTAPSEVHMAAAGLNLSKRAPEIFTVDPEAVLNACEDVVREMCGMCAAVIDRAPEELSADLNDFGAVITGGGAMLSGLDKRIGDSLEIPCRIANTPDGCAIAGVRGLLDADPYDISGFILDKMDRQSWRR